MNDLIKKKAAIPAKRMAAPTTIPAIAPADIPLDDDAETGTGICVADADVDVDELVEELVGEELLAGGEAATRQETSVELRTKNGLDSAEYVPSAIYDASLYHP